MTRPACSPRHRRWCSRFHAELVDNYRAARDAREALRESGAVVPAAHAHGAQLSAYQLEGDDFTAAYPPITFRDWLVAHAGVNAEPEAAPW